MRKLKQIAVALGLTLGTMLAFGALTEPDRQQIPFRNVLQNPGFESGKASWTVSAGTFTLTTTASQVGSGVQAASWATGAAARTFTSKAIPIPAGLYGRQGVASCLIKGATADHTLSGFDGTNKLSTANVTHSTTYSRTSTNFLFPSTGNIQLRITSASSETLYIDDCYLGAAEGFNVSQTNQAIFIGAAYIARNGSCSWSVTSVSLAPFGATAACPGPTVESNPGPGVIQTTDTDLPRFTVNNLPAGEYEVIISTRIDAGVANAGAAIYDGNTFSGTIGFDGNHSMAQTLVGHFSYTSAGNRTFEIYAQNDSSSTSINNAAAGGWQTNFKIYKYPSVAEQTFAPDKLSNSWSGYHSNDCSFTNVTGGVYADFPIDASCTFGELTNTNFGTVTSWNDGTPGNNMPGITFTPSRAGSYFVCATGAMSNGSSQATSWRLKDVLNPTTIIATAWDNQGSPNYNYTLPLCGIYKATSTSPVTIGIDARSSGTAFFDGGLGSHVVNWSIFQIDQSLPGPVITPPVVQPAKSASSGGFSTGAGSFTAVTNLSLTVVQTYANRSWHVGLESDGSGSQSSVTCAIAGASVQVSCYIRILRDGTEIAQYAMGGVANSFSVYQPTSSINFTDVNPPVGSHTYTVEVYETNNGGGGTVSVTLAVLEAHQLP